MQVSKNLLKSTLEITFSQDSLLHLSLQKLNNHSLAPRIFSPAHSYLKCLYGVIEPPSWPLELKSMISVLKSVG